MSELNGATQPLEGTVISSEHGELTIILVCFL